MAILNTLADFTGANGSSPVGSLIFDAAGNLFGATATGGTDDDGTVFEIAKTASGYAGVPTTLANFTGADGINPENGLVADAAGDLFGTTEHGDYPSRGTVFEIAKTGGGYADTPTTIVSFADGDPGLFPESNLITDAAGDLLGTTSGTVFELAKTAGGYTSGATTLANLDGGSSAGLIADAAGDLFGTTNGGGGDNAGTVFEIAKTMDGYASTATVLASFIGADGSDPSGSLVADAAGDLFGTTTFGGTKDDGTVFEIVKTGSGYASTPVVLVNFAGADGESPSSNLIIDAAGDLFGTTTTGGVDGNYGTVFEIAKTAGGYANTPTTLVSFGANGVYPSGGLITDATGDLFGTTAVGGTSYDGTVFEITDSGFVKKTFAVTAGVDHLQGGAENDAFIATTRTLSRGDVITGGSATNILDFVGGGTFDLRAPTTLTGIFTVTVAEGTGAAKPIVFLRDGLDVTVNVVSGTGTTAGVTITGADDASVINLAAGTDTVTVGSADETVHGGGGIDTIKVTGTTIGATVDGGAGASVLELTTGGSAVMGANITDIHHVKLTMAASLTANALSGLTIVGSSGADTIAAGGGGQTLTGDGGADTLIGFAGGGDTFLDTAAHLVLDTIKGFVAGDVIDITNFKPSKTVPTTVRWINGVLSATQGAATYKIALPGSFTGTFTASPDGKAGTDITYTAGPTPTLMTQAMASFGASVSGSGASFHVALQSATPQRLIRPHVA